MCGIPWIPKWTIINKLKDSSPGSGSVGRKLIPGLDIPICEDEPLALSEHSSELLVNYAPCSWRSVSHFLMAAIVPMWLNYIS